MSFINVKKNIEQQHYTKEHNKAYKNLGDDGDNDQDDLGDVGDVGDADDQDDLCDK